jgi:apolipoprotein N-acyltransferase
VSGSWWLATASGVLLALSFPRFGHPACAWVAVAPLLAAIRGLGPLGHAAVVPPRRAVLLGWWAGLLYFTGTVYWTSGVLAQFGELPFVAAVGAMVLLAAYLALYPALAAGVTAACLRAYGDRALVLAPLAWVATEYGRGHLFGGFPWVPLGNSQVTVLPIVQVASVVGVYGLSGIVAAVGSSLYATLIASGRTRLLLAVTTAVCVAALGVWGSVRLAGPLPTATARLRVGLVQGNIAQDDKWDPRQAARIMTTYAALSRDVVRRGAELVIWPESSTPALYEEDAGVGAAVKDLARELGVPILFGSDQLERGANPRFYNAAFLLGPDARTVGVYRKIQLVPFGEFFPFQEWLSFVSPLVERSAPFAAGADVVVLPIPQGRISTAICYEVVYPELARRAVQRGSELLTTITNDGWYGQTSAPYQHFAMASMRAVEQGRFLARAANTGISGFVDPHGRVIEASRIFETAGLVADVGLVRTGTIYGTTGDLVPWVSIVVVAVAVGLARRHIRQPVTPSGVERR